MVSSSFSGCYFWGTLNPGYTGLCISASCIDSEITVNSLKQRTVQCNFIGQMPLKSPVDARLSAVLRAGVSPASVSTVWPRMEASCLVSDLGFATESLQMLHFRAQPGIATRQDHKQRM